MAILSNINDKFAVDSTGAIQFNGQVGTSGYILKSNANAAPTWVDPSTVIGGPYLPLTGGTLTGALAGTSATFEGNVTADKLVIDGASNSNISQLALTRTDYSWGIFNETNLRFYVQSGNTTTPNTQVLELNTSGNATFAGDVNIQGNLTLSVASSFINTAAGDLYINPASNNTTLYDGANAQIFNVYNAGALAIKLNAGTGGGVILAQDGINFEHGYSGNGLVLSHHGIGPSNAIVSGNSVYPDNLYINNGGAASDWSNVIITGNVGIGTISPVSTWLSGFDPSTGNGTFKLTSEGWITTPYLTGLAGYFPGQGARPIVWGDASGTNLQCWDNSATDGVSLRSSNGTTRLFVREDGNVGIGATAPTSKLYLNDPVTNGSSMWTFAPSGQYAYTGHKCWNGIAGTITNNGYYHIGTIEDSRSAIINIKTAAHSNATILVSRGYGPSNLSRFQVLSSTKNANGGYANIIGIRISGGGAVDIQLNWNSGPIIQVEITVYGNGFTIPNTLVPSTSSVGGNYPDNVLWSHSLPSDAGSAMVAGQLRVTGNIVNPGTWGTTTGSAANMHVDSNGTFFRSTSSLKYKKEVRDYDKGLNEVMQLQPKYYKGKDDGDIQFAGLIAEDVHALGLNEFVQYAEDDTPDALAYPNMIALLTKAIQELEARVKELENK